MPNQAVLAFLSRVKAASQCWNPLRNPLFKSIKCNEDSYISLGDFDCLFFHEKVLKFLFTLTLIFFYL